MERLAHRVEQEITGDRYPAAEHEQLGVEDCGQARAGLSERGAELLDRAHRAGVVRGDQRADVVAVEFAVLGACLGESQPDAAGIRYLVRHAQQGAARTVLLDAAARHRIRTRCRPARAA